MLMKPNLLPLLLARLLLLRHSATLEEKELFVLQVVEESQCKNLKQKP